MCRCYLNLFAAILTPVLFLGALVWLIVALSGCRDTALGNSTTTQTQTQIPEPKPVRCVTECFVDEESGQVSGVVECEDVPAENIESLPSLDSCDIVFSLSSLKSGDLVEIYVNKERGIEV